MNQDTGAVKLLKIKDRKPYRHGASTGSKIAKYAPPGGEPIVAVGRIPAADVEAKWPGQGKYGDVWIVPSYLSNGEHFFYVKAVDATNR